MPQALVAQLDEVLALTSIFTSIFTNSSHSNATNTSNTTTGNGTSKNLLNNAADAMQNAASLLGNLKGADLTPEDLAPFSALIDASINAAIQTSVPTAEDDGEEAASMAAGKNNLADSTSSLLNAIGDSLAGSLAEGESLTVKMENCDLVVQKVSLTPPENSTAALADALSSMSNSNSTAPALVVADISPDEMPPLSNSSPPVFVAPAGMFEGLVGVSAVMVSTPAKSTLRSPPPPAGAQSSLLASPVISLSISTADGPLKVNGTGKPIVIASPLGDFTTAGLKQDSNCTILVLQAELCDANATYYEDVAAADELTCFYYARCLDACPDLDEVCLQENDETKDGCQLPTPTAAAAEDYENFQLCIVNLAVAKAAEEEARAICAQIPAPCSGRGSCNSTTDQCMCDDGWQGASCTSKPNCNYMTPEGTWSNEGVTLASASPATGAVCLATHLTEFGVVGFAART